MGKHPRRKIRYIVFKVGPYFERYLLVKDQVKLIQTNAPPALPPINEPIPILVSFQMPNEANSTINQTKPFPNDINIGQFLNTFNPS